MAHGPAKKSAWGDLSSAKNRAKFRRYVAGLRDFSPFISDIRGLIFWRGFSKKIKRTIIAKLKGSDSIGYRRLMALNKRLTATQNQNKSFVFADELAKTTLRIRETEKPAVALDTLPSPKRIEPPRSRSMPWSDPPTPEERRQQARKEQREQAIWNQY